MSDLTVRFNNDKTRGFTNPLLPASETAPPGGDQRTMALAAAAAAQSTNVNHERIIFYIFLYLIKSAKGYRPTDKINAEMTQFSDTNRFFLICNALGLLSSFIVRLCLLSLSTLRIFRVVSKHGPTQSTT